MSDSNVIWLRLVKPIVLLHFILCFVQTGVVSIIYWTTPVKWPFLVAICVLIITDTLLVYLYKLLNTPYGRTKTRKVSVLFNHIR